MAVSGDAPPCMFFLVNSKLMDQDGITDPIGMSGIRLEANVHIVTKSKVPSNNTVKCPVEKASLKMGGLVFKLS